MSVASGWEVSARLWERAKGHVGGGVSTGLRGQMRPHPLYFERGSGARLWDVAGSEYVDYVLGWGPVILGHAHPGVTEAVAAQAGRGLTFGACHRGEFEVAEMVCAVVPGAERVLWSNTGTEAAQVALRLARAATGRRRVVKFAGHYHGWADDLLVGYRPGPGGLDGPGSAGQRPDAAADVVVLPWNDAAAVKEALAGPGADVSAVFAEPVLCNTGVIPPAEGFLQTLRELCDATGTVLVFDEVITGFRMSPGGAAQRYGVTPDLVVLAKAIANGLPLAAVAGSAALIDQTQRGVVHAGTYNGNPVVLAGAAVTLTELARPGVHARIEQLAARLAAGMRAALARAGAPGTAHHVGPVVQCALGPQSVTTVGDYFTADWAAYDTLTVELLRHGVFTLPGGRWYISTAHTTADIDHTLAAFTTALRAATGLWRDNEGPARLQPGGTAPADGGSR